MTNRELRPLARGTPKDSNATRGLTSPARLGQIAYPSSALHTTRRAARRGGLVGASVSGTRACYLLPTLPKRDGDGWRGRSGASCPRRRGPTGLPHHHTRELARQASGGPVTRQLSGQRARHRGRRSILGSGHRSGQGLSGHECRLAPDRSDPAGHRVRRLARRNAQHIERNHGSYVPRSQRRARPGRGRQRSSTGRPSAITRTPFTSTCSTPAEYW